jgi:hypothetical protein
MSGTGSGWCGHGGPPLPWREMHYGCCTKRVFELIENSEESFEVS